MTRSAYWRGFRHGLPFILIVVPFGMVFGVAATEAGLDLIETMSMTILVFAGASQLAALQLLAEGAPVLIVLVAALAVNLRLAMYSAALTPHLGAAPGWQRALMAFFLVDQPYALCEVEFQRRPDLPLPQRVAYFAGTATPITSLWIGATLAGATLGRALPADWGLDFAAPLTFVAMVAPALRSLPHVVAAFVSAALALALAFLPWNLGLILAAGAAMAAGAATEGWQRRRIDGEAA